MSGDILTFDIMIEIIVWLTSAAPFVTEMIFPELGIRLFSNIYFS